MVVRPHSTSNCDVMRVTHVLTPGVGRVEPRPKAASGALADRARPTTLLGHCSYFKLDIVGLNIMLFCACHNPICFLLCLNEISFCYLSPTIIRCGMRK